MLRTLAIAVVAWPLLASAEAHSADLDKAQRQLADGKPEQAIRTLEVASKQTGNRRDTVLRILELQGAALATAGQEAKARTAFEALLALDPKRDLAGKYPSPKVGKAFSDAQAWAQDNPPLEMTAEPAAVDNTGKVLQIAVKVKNDVLKLVRRVRFNVRSDGGKWAEAEVYLQGAYASTGTDSDAVEWFAELLGDREMVLATVGSQRAPVREGKLKEAEKPPEKPPEKKKEEPKTVLKEEVEPQRGGEMVVQHVEPRGGGSFALRAGGYAALGVGFAALAAGSVMGILSRTTTGDLQQKLSGATYVNGAIDTLPGVPHGGAQSYYLGMVDRARVQAICANVLWGVGGGLAVVGVVMALLGRESPVSAGSGGLVVAW